MTGDRPEAPVLRIVKGEPSEDELAALITVVAARTAHSGEADGSPKRRSAWGDPALATRPPMHPGPDGWRRSAFPG